MALDSDTSGVYTVQETQEFRRAKRRLEGSGQKNIKQRLRDVIVRLATGDPLDELHRYVIDTQEGIVRLLGAGTHQDMFSK